MEPSTGTNPLAGYFRQPSIHMRLPSNGKFWNSDDLDMPVTREIPVFPMTTRDEITLKTPDALMNGAGVVSVIESCCPNIKSAWDMPSIDIDAVLIGIRIATYGHEMEFSTKCPHCQADHTLSVDLRTTLGNIVCPDYSNKVNFNGLKIKLKPQRFFGKNRGNAINFEEQKMRVALAKADIDENVRAAEIAKSMERIVELGHSTMADSTEYIELDDGTIVSNQNFIQEFYANSSRELTQLVQDQLAAIGSTAGARPVRTACTDCTKEFDIPLEFDYSNFFGIGY